MKKTKRELGEKEIEALRLVYRHDGAFGRQRLAQVLGGRPSAALQEHDLHRDAAFGACGAPAAARDVLDRLMADGWLRSVERNPNRPVLELTERAATLPRVAQENRREPPPARLEPVAQAQLRRLVRWRDLIALQEGRTQKEVATLRALRALVRQAPETADELAATGLVDGRAPARFRRAVVEVLAGRLGDPTVAEVVQTFATLARGGPVPLTPHLLEWGRSARGGYTRAQLAALDVAWPPPPGWKREVAGRKVPAATLTRFLAPS